MEKSRLYCTFYVDSLFMGISVDAIQEIIRYQEMTPVPLANSVVRGLINLRGQIVTAIDLRRRLNLESRVSGLLPTNVVVRSEGGAVSLLADEIGDIIEVEEEQFEPTLETIDAASRELFQGVYKLDRQLLLILDPEKVVAVIA